MKLKFINGLVSGIEVINKLNKEEKLVENGVRLHNRGYSIDDGIKVNISVEGLVKEVTYIPDQMTKEDVVGLMNVIRRVVEEIENNKDVVEEIEFNI